MIAPLVPTGSPADEHEGRSSESGAWALGSGTGRRGKRTRGKGASGGQRGGRHRNLVGTLQIDGGPPVGARPRALRQAPLWRHCSLSARSEVAAHTAENQSFSVDASPAVAQSLSRGREGIRGGPKERHVAQHQSAGLRLRGARAWTPRSFRRARTILRRLCEQRQPAGYGLMDARYGSGRKERMGCYGR